MRRHPEPRTLALDELAIAHPRHRIRVRAWRREDIDDLARNADHPEVARFLRDRFPSPYTRQDAIAFVETVAAASPREFRAIDIDGAAAGGIGIHPGSDVHRRSGELGYWLAPVHWRAGIMTAVVNGYVPAMMDALGLVRVSAMAYEPNVASQRLLERCGFAFEGRQRRAIVKNGVIMDALVYARVREDDR